MCMKIVEMMKRDRKNAGNYNVYSKSVRMLENIEWMKEREKEDISGKRGKTWRRWKRRENWKRLERAGKHITVVSKRSRKLGNA